MSFILLRRECSNGLWDILLREFATLPCSRYIPASFSQPWPARKLSRWPTRCTTWHPAQSFSSNVSWSDLFDKARLRLLSILSAERRRPLNHERPLSHELPESVWERRLHLVSSLNPALTLPCLFLTSCFHVCAVSSLYCKTPGSHCLQGPSPALNSESGIGTNIDHVRNRKCTNQKVCWTDDFIPHRLFAQGGGSGAGLQSPRPHHVQECARLQLLGSSICTCMLSPVVEGLLDRNLLWFIWFSLHNPSKFLHGWVLHDWVIITGWAFLLPVLLLTFHDHGSTATRVGSQGVFVLCQYLLTCLRVTSDRRALQWPRCTTFWVSTRSSHWIRC